MSSKSAQTKKILSLNSANLYYFLQGIRLLFRFIKDLFKSSEATKTSKQSKDTYNAYDNKEQKSVFDEKERLVIFEGRLKIFNEKKVRLIHLEYIKKQINKLLDENNGNDPIKVLEIGCGNCLNLYFLKKEFGDRCKFVGIDISEGRLSVARNYFKDDLKNVSLINTSATDLTQFEDSSFDLVYSMFCLEQITYEIKYALKEIFRVSKSICVFLEPDYENANFTQKLYLILSDHIRILRKTINELGPKKITIEKMPLQFNPLNQSTVFYVHSK